jgi:hypothetical protein
MAAVLVKTADSPLDNGTNHEYTIHGLRSSATYLLKIALPAGGAFRAAAATDCLPTAIGSSGVWLFRGSGVVHFRLAIVFAPAVSRCAQVEQRQQLGEPVRPPCRLQSGHELIFRIVEQGM